MTVTDDAGNTATQEITLTVTPVVDLTATDDSFTTDEDTPLTDSVATNDSTISGGTLSYSLATAATNGTVVVAGDGTFTYTPNADFNGTDSFTYTVVDAASGESSTQMVDITINQINDEGVFGGDLSVTTNEDTAVNGTVTFSDTADGDTTPNFMAGTAANGTVTIDSGTGAFTYTPGTDFNGTDSFVVTATDEDGNSESVTVNVTVTAVDDATTFGGDTSGTGAEDGGMITGTLTASDDDGLTDPIFTIESGNGASNGTATIDSATGDWEYTPNANFNGSDSFIVTVTDDAGNTATQEITLTVTPVVDLTATDDSFTTDEDTPLTDSVATNDSTISGGTLSYSLDSGPTNGSLVFNGDGTFTYTPNADYNGADSFTYIVDDQDAGESSTQTVNITIDPVNDAPVANDLDLATPFDQPLPADTVVPFSIDGTLLKDPFGDTIGDLASDIDSTLDSTSFDFGNATATATVTINGVPQDILLTDLMLTYNPVTGDLIFDPTANTVFAGLGDGEVAFVNVKFGVTDNFNNDGTPFDVGNILFKVGGVNDAPTIAGPVTGGATEDDSTFTVDLLTGANDVDGDTLSVDSLTLTGGDDSGVTIAGGNLIVDPNAYNHLAVGESEVITYSYNVIDGNGGSVAQTATITITGVDDAAIAVDDTASTTQETAVTVDVLANDNDPDTSDTLSIDSFTQGANGSVTQVGSDLEYTPNTGFSGTDSFTYTLAGGGTATVTITVDGVNTPPVAQPDAFTADEDTVVTGNVLVDNGSGVDSDADGDSLTVSLLTPPSTGELSLLANGNFTFTPAEDFVGTETFVYQISDGNGGTSSATVSMTFTAVNDAPALDDASFNVAEDASIGASVGTVTATDVDSTNLTYSITSGNAAGKFAINPTTGEITVADGLNFEDVNFYSLTIQVEDDGTPIESDTATVTIVISNVNDAPVVGDETFSVTENVPTGTVVGSVTGTDEDAGQSITYAITAGDPQGDFAIDPVTGEITVAGDIDFEDISSYTLTVTATDDGSPTASGTATVTINVADLADEVGPRVTAVRVDSDAWTDHFRDFVDGAFQDGIATGYSIPTGGNQLNTLPWVNINKIQIEFNEDVSDSLDISDFSLDVTAGLRADLTTASIPRIVDVDWDAANNRAILTLDQSIEPAIINVVIADNAITDFNGNLLDGEWTNGTSTQSGDANPGGDFNYQFRVLPGDVNSVGTSFEIVDGDDLDDILGSQFEGIVEFGGFVFVSPNYDPLLDIDGSNLVDSGDASAVQRRNQSRLLQPSGPMMSLSSLILPTTPTLSMGVFSATGLGGDLPSDGSAGSLIDGQDKASSDTGRLPIDSFSDNGETEREDDRVASMDDLMSEWTETGRDGADSAESDLFDDLLDIDLGWH